MQKYRLIITKPMYFWPTSWREPESRFSFHLSIIITHYMFNLQQELNTYINNFIKIHQGQLLLAPLSIYFQPDETKSQRMKSEVSSLPANHYTAACTHLWLSTNHHPALSKQNPLATCTLTYPQASSELWLRCLPERNLLRMSRDLSEASKVMMDSGQKMKNMEVLLGFLLYSRYEGQTLVVFSTSARTWGREKCYFKVIQSIKEYLNCCWEWEWK